MAVILRNRRWYFRGCSRVGQVIYPALVADADAMFEVALEAGAQDVESTNDGHEVICDPNDFNDVRDRLEESSGQLSLVNYHGNRRTM